MILHLITRQSKFTFPFLLKSKDDQLIFIERMDFSYSAKIRNYERNHIVLDVYFETLEDLIWKSCKLQFAITDFLRI